MHELKLIFSYLKSGNLKIQLNKSESLTKRVEFLGHIIIDKVLQPNPKKIAVIVTFPIPKSIKEIVIFLQEKEKKLISTIRGIFQHSNSAKI